MDPFKGLIDQELARFEKRLDAVLQADVDLAHEIARYMATLKGKRLRPALALLSAKAAGGWNEKVIDAAAAVEMIHAATMVTSGLYLLARLSLLVLLQPTAMAVIASPRPCRWPIGRRTANRKPRRCRSPRLPPGRSPSRSSVWAFHAAGGRFPCNRAGGRTPAPRRGLLHAGRDSGSRRMIPPRTRR